MKQRRHTKQLNIVEAIEMMANGDCKAQECLKEMLSQGIVGTLDILMMDSLEIYGEKIVILWEKCEHNPERLHEVMDTYRKQFTKVS